MDIIDDTLDRVDAHVVISAADDGKVTAKGSQVAKQTDKCIDSDCTTNATMFVGIGCQTNGAPDDFPDNLLPDDFTKCSHRNC